MKIISSIINLFGRKKIYLIGDLHLDHKNIIRYCHRPFGSVEEMNGVLLKNWNSVIGKKDIVYFLGDLTFRSNKIGYWLRRLNGTIIIIKGNHDKAIRRGHLKKIIKYKDMKFMLIHDPRNIPKDWKEWIIHGHKHNNNMKHYPLINRKRKTINVSCELIKYKPIHIEKIYQMIKLN